VYLSYSIWHGRFVPEGFLKSLEVCISRPGKSEKKTGKFKTGLQSTPNFQHQSPQFVAFNPLKKEEKKEVENTEDYGRIHLFFVRLLSYPNFRSEAALVYRTLKRFYFKENK